MPKQDQRGNAAWVRQWLRVGDRLEAVRREELHNFDYASQWRAVDALLQMACDFARPRTTSGLVEQQRLFWKAQQ